MIRAAKLENSSRLQAVFEVLNRGGWWTAGDIRRATGDAVEAVPTAVQELKANGITVECRHMDGQYRYRTNPCHSRLSGVHQFVTPACRESFRKKDSGQAGMTKGHTETQVESLDEFRRRHGLKENPEQKALPI